MVDLVVRNATVFDGSGGPPFAGDVAVQGGRMELVGDAAGVEAAREINAAGKAVSPGFIDVHSHADFPIYVDGLAQSGIRQGLTTLVIGNCGHGPAPAPDRELTKVVTIGYDEEWGIDLAWNDVRGVPGGPVRAGPVDERRAACRARTGTSRGHGLRRPCPFGSRAGHDEVPGGRGHGGRRNRLRDGTGVLARPERCRAGANSAGGCLGKTWRLLRQPHPQPGRPLREGRRRGAEHRARARACPSSSHTLRQGPTRPRGRSTACWTRLPRRGPKGCGLESTPSPTHGARHT